MSTKRFLLGLISGLSVAAAGMAGTYVYLRESRRRAANIRGYLDLIPDLTPEQRAEVREIRRAFLPKVEVLRWSMRAERAKLADLLFDETVPRSELDSVVEQILKHQADLEHGVIEHILEEREILTPSQRQRFHDIIVAQFASGGVGVHDLRRSSDPGR